MLEIINIIKQKVDELKANGVPEEEINRQLQALRSEIDAKLLTPLPQAKKDGQEPSEEQKQDENISEEERDRLFGK